MIFDLPFPSAPDSEEPAIPELSDTLLGELFAAAKETLKVRPWKTLHDTDWFGIVDPETGETHIVAWNEEDLDETDMERNERFGKAAEEVGELDSFLFRSTLPGCVNWHPTEDEARKILDARRLVPCFLKQTKKLPQRCYDAEFGDIMPWIPCHGLPENKDRSEAGDWQLATVRFGIGPDPEYDDQAEHTTTLKSVFKREGSKIHYVYDFGDNWSHLIKLEEKVKSKPGETGPACLTGRGIAPPEDCGGIWGFLNLLDPDSSYAEELDWVPEHLRPLREGKFDPKSVVFH